MRRLWLASALVCCGCSTAPVADFLDWVSPAGRMEIDGPVHGGVVPGPAPVVAGPVAPVVGAPMLPAGPPLPTPQPPVPAQPPPAPPVTMPNGRFVPDLPDFTKQIQPAK